MPLPALPAASGGLARPVDLGLSEQLWQGVSFKVWQSLLTKQPQRQSSPALRHVLAGTIAARAILPVAPTTTDSALLRAQALNHYASAENLGLFIATQPESARTPALLSLRQTATQPRSEAEVQLQADLARESGKQTDERDDKLAALQSGDAAAAEWLATYGYISADQLAAAYLIHTTGESDHQLMRANLWREIQSNTGRKNQLLKNFIDNAGVNGIVGTRGALLLGPLRDTSARSNDTAAALFALAAAQDQREFADDWYAALEQSRATVDEAESWQARLWPVAVAMGLSAVNPSDLPNWVQAAVGEDLPVFAVLTLLEARGLIISPEAWDKASNGPGLAASTKSDQAQLDLLKSAATSGRQGETILRAGILAGTDFAEAPAPTAAAIIRAFTTLGLNQLADDLTVEALLALLYPSHG